MNVIEGMMSLSVLSAAAGVLFVALRLNGAVRCRWPIVLLVVAALLIVSCGCLWVAALASASV